jgi:uncharacterized protein (TIGR02266 family)
MLGSRGPLAVYIRKNGQNKTRQSFPHHGSPIYNPRSFIICECKRIPLNQDTRKDKRAKDINLVVRYKSATLDEFIEHHSYDISRGGLYIKTSKPFAPGTLLKFELRLSGDAQLIAGVGRVVWKREAPQGDASRPAGMGVKFIKIEDAAK